jgi:oligopeptide transport system ATP-binding protein
MPLLSVRNLRTWFPVYGGVLRRRTGEIKAVDEVSFDIEPGQTVGLVGESGSGKTTVGRTLLKLTPATSGEVLYEGRDILPLGESEFRPMRKDLQMIFQDPFGSLNPRMTIGAILAEPLEIHFPAMTKDDRRARVAELLKLVGLPADAMGRYPHEFSGGQRQRIGIARALALQPKLIVCDEPVSALDVSIQAQVMNLLEDLQREFNLTYLFIAHDLAVVRCIADRVAVMYLGRIVELGPASDVFARPQHPYTQALLSAIPRTDPRAVRQRIVLQGDVPSPLAPPEGCHFHTRCPAARQGLCEVEAPRLRTTCASGPGHVAACHLVDAAD